MKEKIAAFNHVKAVLRKFCVDFASLGFDPEGRVWVVSRQDEGWSYSLSLNPTAGREPYDKRSIIFPWGHIMASKGDTNFSAAFSWQRSGCGVIRNFDGKGLGVWDF